MTLGKIPFSIALLGTAVGVEVSQFEFLRVGALSTGKEERQQLRARRNITAGARVRRRHYIWPKAVGDFP